MKPEVLVKQLEEILADFQKLDAKSTHSDLSDLPKHERQALITRIVSAVDRITGGNSSYSKELNRIFQALPELHVHTTSVVGIAEALLADLKSGALVTLVELAHADLFNDFIEMAEHLLAAGYKDASAVIAGSALEVHLRTLCTKNSITTTSTKPDSSVVAKKADTLNSDLAAALIYEKLDQKSVTAWLDLRNKAAHGKYAEYSKEQVELMIAGVTNFISRNPA